MIIFTSLARYIFIETKLMLVLSFGSTTSGTGFLLSSLVCWWAPPSPGSVCSSDWPAQEAPSITTLCGLHIPFHLLSVGFNLYPPPLSIRVFSPLHFSDNCLAFAAPGVVGPALLLRMFMLALVQVRKRVFVSSSDSFRSRENKECST